MKSPVPGCLPLSFPLILFFFGLSFHPMAAEPPPPAPSNTSSATPATSLGDSGDAAPALSASPAPVVAAASPTATPLPAPAPPLAAPPSGSSPALVSRDIPDIHATILLPKDWTLLPGKLLEGDELLATREKISSDHDPWTTGLSMTIDRNGAKDSGQKASEYARALAREANVKAGDEATPLKESQAGPFHEIRFDFPVEGDQPILITEVLRANDATGTLAVILWQSPKEEAPKLQSLKESILAGLKLDPTR